MFDEPAKQSIGQLLSFPKLSIPVYQRGYAWGDDEVDDFVGDVRDLWNHDRQDQRQHFLGTMLCYNKLHAVYGHTLEIIDGQQRLTTTSLLVLALRETGRVVLASKYSSEQIKAPLTTFIGRTDELLVREVQGEVAPKLTLNEKDSAEWYRLVTTGVSLEATAYRGASASVRRLNDAFTKLRQELLDPIAKIDSPADSKAAVEELERRFTRLLGGLVVVLLTAASEKDVYELFMIINDRGKPLSTLDLVRTGTLSRLKTDRPRFEQAKEEFAPLLEVEDDQCRKALVHYINSHTGVRVPKNALLKQLSRWLYEGEGLSSFSEGLLRRVKSVSAGATYLLAISEDKQHRAGWQEYMYPFPMDQVGKLGLERQERLVDALKHESAKPLLVAGSEVLKPKRFLVMLGVLERIAMRAFLTSGVHKSTLADFHIQQAKLMRSPQSGWTPGQMWLDALARSLPPGRVVINLADACPDEAFKKGVRELRFKGNRNIIAYLLLGIDGFDFPDNRPNQEISYRWSDIHLDHIAPQSIGDDPIAEAGLVHTVGNLAPLAGAKNMKLRNLHYGTVKANIYKMSRLRMTKRIGLDHDEHWTTKDVLQRAEEIAQQASQVWSLSPDLWDK
jgi:hypothetical protein